MEKNKDEKRNSQAENRNNTKDLNNTKNKKEDNTKNKNKDKDNKKDIKSSLTPFIWLFIFVGLTALLLFRFSSTKTDKWDQSRFLKELENNNIKSIEMTPINSLIIQVKGSYIKENTDITTPELKEKKDKNKDKDNSFKTDILKSESIIKIIDKARQNGVKVKTLNDDTWAKDLFLTLFPILLIVGLLYLLFSRQIKQAGRGAMQFGKSKARMIMPEDHKITFDDIAGADEAKEEIAEIVEYLKTPEKFQELGGKIPRGILLMGSPGTGKTLLAKAVAGEAKVPFFSISGSDFVEMFVGVGASRVRDMFEEARKLSPSLIFIDEIDAVGRSRFSGIGGGHDEREQTLNAMLVEMDGLETKEGVIILAATNRPDVLDPALLRPGRFDRQVTMDLPDIKGRREILDVHIKTFKITDDVDLDKVAKGTPGFSGADLANLINEAALLAVRNKRKAANNEDFEEARDKVKWGRERKSRKISERERKLTAYHEAGHALVGIHCKYSEPLHKVTIIPRGQAYLGATMHLPEEDKYTQSKKELLDSIVVYMGGRVAEEIIFDDITNGASSDIEQATNIAKLMVCYYGMNDKLGPIHYGERTQQIHLGRDITQREPYSSETARDIDVEIKKILDNAKKQATKILTKNIDDLEKLSQELLEKETLDANTIYKLLNMENKIK